MKITIITVAYNSAATIGDTLDSVASQSYRDIEHIVIDGASRDGTLDVLRLRGSHVARVISERDGGIYEAMNKGLSLASGEYVGFLNADDMLFGPNVVSEIARAAGQPGIDAVFGDLLYVKQDRPEQVVRYWRSGSFSPERLRFGWMPPHPTLYVRRSRIDSLGPFASQLRIAADYDFILRCLSSPGIGAAYVPKVFVKMRVGGASNRSLRALFLKSREDLIALRRNRVGGCFTLLCKNVRKVPQFLLHPRHAEG